MSIAHKMSMPPVASCAAIVLAAGASSRLGTPKQLLPYGGKALLVRTVEALLAAPVWPVVVVVGAQADRVRPLLAPYPVLTTYNEGWPEGMASSVRSGITTVQQFSSSVGAALLCVCDQPVLGTAQVLQLVTAAREGPDATVAARYAGRLGVPAVFPRARFAELAALTGDTGARGLLERSAGPVIGIDLPELAFDIDSPSDVGRDL